MAPISQPQDAIPSLSKLENLLIRAITPTRTLLDPASLVRRQTVATVTVVPDSDNAGPNGSGDANSDDDQADSTQTLTGGVVAGIVIGSIAGLLLLIWIFRSCSNLGAPPGASGNPGGQAWYDGVRDEYPPRHTKGHRTSSRSRSRHSHHSHRHHHYHPRRSGSVVREVQPVAVMRSASPRAPPVVYDDRARRGRRERRERRSRDYDGY
ncbi:hypothetical protein B0T14DRAFT_271957 [Immersiella caudata]|uniref:Uncharacterized protein n=1 Tax=Immersiella caudata TaxID=314043 RepID=A0AA39WLC1_9PEZI|nr:hypothetical protein B0T14DRAFT_271957 [Immersiella caudata]